MIDTGYILSLSLFYFLKKKEEGSLSFSPFSRVTLYLSLSVESILTSHFVRATTSLNFSARVGLCWRWNVGIRGLMNYYSKPTWFLDKRYPVRPMDGSFYIYGGRLHEHRESILEAPYRIGEESLWIWLQLRRAD
ncbi:unnamed protein product [Cuscuta epithymum]|uniref:Uncharacterized protein n=1 Tax=Cuscuta epithymum TaxID=186058 RepID=A0AAV0E9J7_9ASTE|nr:unnamed protein product [Cuscuta epithymum]